MLKNKSKNRRCGRHGMTKLIVAIEKNIRKYRYSYDKARMWMCMRYTRKTKTKITTNIQNKSIITLRKLAKQI